MPLRVHPGPPWPFGRSPRGDAATEQGEDTLERNFAVPEVEVPEALRDTGRDGMVSTAAAGAGRILEALPQILEEGRGNRRRFRCWNGSMKSWICWIN